MGGRKLVTALFCDVVGSTVLVESQDPEVVRRVMEQWFESAEGALTRHGGLVEKYIGDAVVAIFGVPVQHEDDAVRACQAALALLSPTTGPGGPSAADGLSVRIGVESGPAVVGDTSRGSTFATGTPVNLAARLQQSAEPGTCLVGPTCSDLVAGTVGLEPLGHLRVKGIRDDVRVCRLTSAPRVPPERPQLGAFVGRRDQLARIADAVTDAAERRTGRLVTLVGEAGMGKTRLVDEALRSLPPGLAVLRTRCLAYGDGVAWWPLVDLVRQAAGMAGDEPFDLARRRVADLVGEGGDLVAGCLGPAAGLGGTPSTSDDIAWALERLIERVAGPGGALVVVEDGHWASDSMVDVLDQIAAWIARLPVVLLVNTRPELLERHPVWGGASPDAELLQLEGLSEGEVAELVRSMLAAEVDQEAVARICTVVGGNPLYAVQTVSHLVDEGALQRLDGAPWHLVDERVPTVHPVVSALIASRVDNLPDPQRRLMGAAAVMGEVFYRRPLPELGASGTGTALIGLLRTGMIRPCDSDLPGEQALRFEHSLIRDAAYSSLALHTRASMHQGFAGWLAHEHPDPVHDGIVGSHLEAAHASLVRLGRADDPEVTSLGVRAAERLANAARQLARVDEAASVGLFRRALQCAPAGPQRWVLQIELARRLSESYIDSGEAARLAEGVSAEARGRGETTLAAMAGLLVTYVSLTRGTGSARSLEVAVQRLASLGECGPLGRLLLRDAESMLANLRTDATDLKQADVAAADAAADAGYPAEALALRQAVDFKRLFDDTPVAECAASWRAQLEVSESRWLTLKAAAALKLLAAISGWPDTEVSSWGELEEQAAQVRTPVWEPVLVLRASTSLYLSDWQQALELQERLCRDLAAAGAAGRVSTEAAFAAVAGAQLGDVAAAHRYASVALRHAVDGDITPTILAAAVETWVGLERDDLSPDPASFSEHPLAPDVLPDRALVALTDALTADRLGERALARRLREHVRQLYLDKGAVQAASCVGL